MQDYRSLWKHEASADSWKRIRGMTNMKIGAVTIGQSPRVDVTKDIMGIFGSSVELIQAGGLDGLTKEEIKAFAPEKDDYVLVSRLTDGSSVTFAERFILPRFRRL